MDNERISQFKADIVKLKVPTRGARRDGLLQVLGVGLMAVGAVADLIVYQSSRSMSDPRDIQSNIILAIGFLALAGIGAAVFLYASLAKFLRLWLLRQVYEGQSHVDQVVAAVVGRAPEPIPSPAASSESIPAPAAEPAPKPGSESASEAEAETAQERPEVLSGTPK